MSKSLMAQDCAAGYTLRASVKRSVARDPITSRDIREMYRKGWRVFRKMEKLLADADKLPGELQ